MSVRRSRYGNVEVEQVIGFRPLDRTVQETTTAAGSTKTKQLSYLGLTGQVVSEETPGAGGGAATVSASYTYGPTGERISQTKSPGAPTEDTAYYGLNPHTDVETLTDQTGNATSTYRYTGYGSNDASGFTGKDKQTATAGPEVEPYNPYRFNSKRWDPATGSYDMGFRDYSPGLNRFLTRDMYNGALADLRLGGDRWNTNRYAFAGGNPITGIEYDGHFAIDENGEPIPVQPPSRPAMPTVTNPRLQEILKDTYNRKTRMFSATGRPRPPSRTNSKPASQPKVYITTVMWSTWQSDTRIFFAKTTIRCLGGRIRC